MLSFRFALARVLLLFHATIIRMTLSSIVKKYTYVYILTISPKTQRQKQLKSHCALRIQQSKYRAV